jgi:hypothetical protein
MKNTTSKLTTRALLFAAAATATTASADDYFTSPPSAPGPGLINEFLRGDNEKNAAWDIGVQVRLRYEDKNNFGVSQNGGPAAGANDFKSISADRNNSLEAERVTPHLGYNADWYGFFVEGRGSYTTGDDRNPNPESNGPMDLHQAYLALGNIKEFPVTLKVGRQELSYGDERLIGAFDWNNIGRTFDAAKLRWQSDSFSLDVFTSKVVISDDNNLDKSNDYDWFSGAYFSTKLIPRQVTELYFLSRNTSSGSPTVNGIGLTPLLSGPASRDIYTIGTRWKSNAGDWNNWDYLLEAAYQFGHFNDTALPVATRSLKQEAYMATGSVGYTFANVSMTPRVGVELVYSSGDGNAKDGVHGTFDNLFPTNHRFYGIMDTVSLENIQIARLTASIKPVPRLTLTADMRGYWLADTHDNFYTVSGFRRGGIGATPGTGYGINPNYGSYVGSEIDLVASVKLAKWVSAEAGIGHYFVGDYIRQSLAAPTVGSRDANYLYLQTTFTF